MPTTETQLGPDSGKTAPGMTIKTPDASYHITVIESPGFLASLWQGLQDVLHPPRVTIPSKYYRGEATLPVTEMKAWYRDLPEQIKTLFEKPTDPIGIFNRRQEKKRALCGAVGAIVLAVVGVFLRRPSYIIFGAVGGCALGEMLGVLVFKKREYPQEIWQDYRPQSASWLNSVLVHAVLVAALILPFYISRWLEPVKAASVQVVDISPYLPQLPPSPNKAGGGGGGGDRSPTPPSKGKIPKFAKDQLAPPMAKIPDLHPKLPVQPTLLGPPDLKLPQMALNAQLGDPLQGVPGPPSNGPGTGGGIGTGSGTGIGPGNGGGLGPGDTAGTGGGAFSVGGNVSAPIPIYKPEPPYSEEARKAKYQGTVVLWIVVDTQGQVTNAQVVKALGMGLDEKAVQTVKTWKFIPAKRNGVPVPVRVMVEVSFRLF